MPDIIAAIATAPGRGGIGVVRVSGPVLAGWAEALCGRDAEPRRIRRARFLDAAGRIIDDGMLVFFPAPHSYTGEDVLELHGHGGPVVMQMLLARCLELGARIAEPGEFTRRAFLNDKIDLAQAEGVADLIEAQTERAARSALRSLSGVFSAQVTALVEKLIELRMWVESAIDFPEEAIERSPQAALESRLAALQGDLAGLRGRARQGSMLRAGLQVVIAGQPNVGKSSLLNALAGEEVAIVTDIAGTTRDALRQAIQIEGVPLQMVDTAGLRESDDPVERIGMERTWSAVARADLILLVVDARHGVTGADEALLARFPPGPGRLVVHNKADLAGPIPGGAPPLRVSARTGQGLKALRAALLESAGLQAADEDLPLARERHLVALARAGGHLEAAAAVLARSEIEFVAEELRLAQQALSAITGEFSADDLLGEIFSRFCIGK
jgi:tRNA modification GTPase